MKTNDEQTVELSTALQPLSLRAQQQGQRSAALAGANNSFIESLAKDAFSTRGELVERLLTRLMNPKVLNWLEHAVLCVGLGDIRTRDGLLRRLHDSPDQLEQVRVHLVREVARSHDDYVAPLATVFAGTAWLDGQNDVTRLAVDRALENDPTYSLAQLLDIALRHNVPPAVWSSSLAAVSFDACLKGAA